VSDGLVGDVAHLAEASGCDVVISEARLASRLAPELSRVAARLGISAVISGLSALVLLAGVVWWAPGLKLAPERVVLFLALGCLAAWLPRVSCPKPV
jgi:hypothetical protein